MPAHKEEQKNTFELCKNALLRMWKNKTLKNTDLVLKYVPKKFEQNFLKGNAIYLVAGLCLVQCPLAYITRLSIFHTALCLNYDFFFFFNSCLIPLHTNEKHINMFLKI